MVEIFWTDESKIWYCYSFNLTELSWQEIQQSGCRAEQQIEDLRPGYIVEIRAKSVEINTCLIWAKLRE